MKTARDRLEFAIRFAEMDLQTLRPGDWMNLSDDLGAFHGRDVPGGVTLKDLGGFIARPTDGPLSEERFQGLQREVQSLLRALVAVRSFLRDLLASDKPAANDEPVSPPLPPIPVMAEYIVTAGIKAGGTLYVEGRTRDVTLLRLMHLLTGGGIDAVFVCPECDRLFYRVRRQLFCSKKCVNRANKRAARSGAKADRTMARAGSGERPRSGRRKKASH